MILERSLQSREPQIRWLVSLFSWEGAPKIGSMGLRREGKDIKERGKCFTQRAGYLERVARGRGRDGKN